MTVCIVIYFTQPPYFMILERALNPTMQLEHA